MERWLAIWLSRHMQFTEVPGPSGRLLANLLYFARLLRRLGLAVNTGQVRDLAVGLTHIDIGQRDDFYHAASSFLVHSPEERVLFDRAFDQFWAAGQEWLLVTGGSRQQAESATKGLPVSQQAAPDGKITERTDDESEDEPDAAQTDVTATYSPLELLHRKDFAAYTEAELQAAQRFIDGLAWRLGEHLTRRQERAAKRADYLDLPRTIQGSLNYGGEIVELSWRRRKRKPRPLTVICDISGSMDRYSRLFLHFIYALAAGSQRVETFVFGTRLTRITLALRHGDVDRALDDVSALVQDWAGGTRIGESLKTFNFEWARRVLGRGAVTVIISDGWDRGEIALLEGEVSRLRRSVHRLIWLNPLMGSPDYQPLALGIQTVLPYVDDFYPLHNLASLEQLALELGYVATVQ